MTMTKGAGMLLDPDAESFLDKQETPQGLVEFYQVLAVIQNLISLLTSSSTMA